MKIAIIDKVGSKAGIDHYDNSLLRGLIAAGDECYLYSNFDCDEPNVKYKKYFHNVGVGKLKSIISSASQLMNKIGNEEINLPGWIQDHITNAENYIDQANQGYHELNEVGYSQASYTHMRPFKLEIANIMSQLGALNDKIEQNGPLSEEIVDAIESLGMLISNINTSRKI
jgi:hypothetical protein